MPPSVHPIQIPSADRAAAPLAMGGTDPLGRAIQVNQRYLTLDGAPWLPVMGEFHFSRFPRERWAEELLKMKAGGINVIATYIFWIHIEEAEGALDWSGDRDLRHFIQLCADLGLYAYPRIGPWAHGECRNGGFPDWLLEKCGSAVRMDAQPYLQYVERFYRAIFAQLRGLLWKEGGPIIGIQIENEMLNNPGHIRTLKRMAQSIGFDVPLYTMTGWGPAQVPQDEPILPVFGGYPDAFWDRQVQEWSRPSRKHYFFTAIRDDNTIGADLARRSEVGDLSFLEQVPYGTCETGGGMQVAYHRRPYIAPGDISAIALSKVGSGSNLQGYYMYHGGANPRGKFTTLQESQATGYWNDVPVINYDFQAPLGQYGQVRESYHALRPLHLFLQDFGDLLAPLPLVLPEQVPQNLDDRATLRWALRSDGRQAFLFINNYQRVEPLAEHKAAQFELRFPEETLLLPSTPMRIPTAMQAVLPVNLRLGGALLKYATAQPICTVQWENKPLYVFAALDGAAPEFVFDRDTVQELTTQAALSEQGDRLAVQGLTPGTGCLFTVRAKTGEAVSVLLLAPAQAQQVWKARVWGQERLFLSPEALYFTEDGVQIQIPSSQAVVSVSMLPSAGDLGVSGAKVETAPDGIFTRYTLSVPTRAISVESRRVQAAAVPPPVRTGSQGVATPPPDEAYQDAEVWRVSLPSNVLDGLHEAFLRVEYTGDAARAYLNGTLIDDDFYHGRVWEIGLQRFAPEILAGGLELRFLPLRKDAPIYLPSRESIPFGEAEAYLQVESITAYGVADLHLSKM